MNSFEFGFSGPTPEVTPDAEAEEEKKEKEEEPESPENEEEEEESKNSENEENNNGSETVDDNEAESGNVESDSENNKEGEEGEKSELEEEEDEIVEMLTKRSGGLQREKERKDEYNGKNLEEKGKESEEYEKEYREALFVTKDENTGEEIDISKEDCDKKIEEIKKTLEGYESDGNRLKRQNEFLELLQKDKDFDLAKLESSEIDLVNKCLEDYGEIFGLQADRAKVEYLNIVNSIKNEEERKKFLEEQHLPHTQAISELERYAELMKKGIGGFDEGEEGEMSGYIDTIKQTGPGLKKLMESGEMKLGKEGRKGKWWIWYVIAMIITTINYILDGKRWDKWMEKLTGRKVYLVKSKEKGGKEK